MSIPFEENSSSAPKPRMSGRARLLVSLMAPLVGVLFAEVYVRGTGLAAIPMPRIQGAVFASVSDPLLLYVNKPNAKKVIHYDDGPGKRWSVTMESNANRFRGPEVSLEKPEGTTRVACLGDSHTWGEGVEFSESWPAQLQGFAQPNVEVMNCGVNAYDTLQEVLWYERFVEKFDPDVVVIQYFSNDVAARGLGKLGGKAEKDSWVSLTHPRRKGTVGFLRERLVSMDTLFDRIYRWRSLRARQDSWTSRYTEEGVGWRRVRDGLLRLRDRCARDEREFYVALFPYLVPEGDGFASHDVLEITADFCRENGMKVFNGEPSLLAVLDREDPGALRVSLNDFHANGTAYAAFSRELAAWLATEGLPFRSE
ncbi:MAG: lysophospholipase L1-like esterase [Planctomycetota bacterium]|jgi:lysophospholipase L1-like esterase